MTDRSTMFCSHCGSTGHHTEDNCTVKDATRRILANYKPRGATTGQTCPDCGLDGRWHWGKGSRTFVCECGAEVQVA